MELKYKRNRKLIEFNCDYCGNLATKPLSEYNRNNQLGRHSFCCRSCSVRYATFNHLTNTDK